jgi:hypothetical protein
MLAWPPALVMLAGWCCDNEGRIRKPVWLLTMAASNITLAVVMWLVSVTGHLGVLTPPSDPLRHLRGWDNHHAALIALISDHPVKMIITDRRGTAALMTHALRDSDITITIIDADGRPSNHFEASHPYQSSGKGDQVILMTEAETPPTLSDIRWIGTIGESRVSISQTRNRHLYFHLGVENP